MGEVFLAEDTSLRRKIAIKMLQSPFTTDEKARLRLVREAQAAAALDHPNICAIYEVDESDGHTFICMQYVAGETLETLIKHKSLDLGEILGISIQVADALVEAHARGIIHRDIKPGKIMITQRGSVKVMDFGLAKPFQPEGANQSEAETVRLISTQGTVIGTLPYMSPEQVRGDALDGRSDIFSFGVVLYELLSGLQLFAQKSTAATAAAILTSTPLALARSNKDVPAELERILGKTLRKIPDERYQAIKDLLIDLRSLKDELDFQHRLERSSTSKPLELGSTMLTEPKHPALAATAKRTVPTVDPLDARTTGDKIVRAGFRWTWLIAIVLLAVLGVTGWLLWRNANMHWAKSQVAKIEELEKAGKYLQAYDLSIVIQKYLGQDETINRLMPTISDVISVTSDPGDVANGLRSLPASIEDRLVPLIKSGRAVFGIVLEGYLERRRPEGYVTPDPSTVEYKELIVNRVTDVRRGLDYLLTRNDIDSHRIAFFGPSAGANWSDISRR
jgi:tRNA A-37 threonylcarbamoyl transferase component Bud32